MAIYGGYVCRFSTNITSLFKLYMKYPMLCKAIPKLYLNNVRLYLELYVGYVRLYLGYT
jgi:hypothetical protein